MAYTSTTVIGERLYEKLAPWHAVDPEGDLARLCDSIGAMTEPVAELIEDEGFDGQAGFVPSYGKAMNPQTCPVSLLPWLGMFVGVPIPQGMPESEARALVKAEAGIQRGTETSVRAAIERSISQFWAPETEYLKGQLVRHEGTAGELLCYEATATFTSGASFATTHLSLVNIATQYELLSREKANGESSAFYFTVVANPKQLLPEGNTTQLDEAIKGTKPAGLVPEYVLTEERTTNPYIDEFMRLIENIEGEIETLTLKEVT